MQQTTISEQSNLKYISVKDLRQDLASVLDRVALRGETFAVTKFGVLRATINPAVKKLSGDKMDVEESLKQSFGTWKRTDTALALSQQIRARAERRNETLSN